MGAYIGSDGDGTRLWDITGHDNLLANVTWLTASEIQQYFSWSASTTDIKFSNNSIYFSNLSNTAKSFNININNIPKKYIGFYFSVNSSLDISTLAMGPGDIQVIFTFQKTNTITAFQSATGTSADGTVGCIFDSKKEENITANFKIRTAGSSYYCYIFLLDDLSIFSEVITTSDNKAHNISKAYIGVPTEKTKDVPRQKTTTTTKTISCTVNDANTASQYKKLSDLFTITNGSSYYFANTNTESTNNYSTYKSNNGGRNSTTASTTLTALHDFSALSFGYSYSGESNYDYVTLTVGGTTIESKASGSTTNKTWSGTLSKGQTIKITYTKDSSYNEYDDCGTIYNIQATYQATVTETTAVIDKVGTGEYVNLARKVKKAYIGDSNGKARLCFAGSTPFIIGKIKFDVSPTYNIKIENIPFKPYKAFILFGMYFSNGKLATIADNKQESVVGAYEDKVFYADGNLFKVSDKNSMQVIYGDNYVEVQAGDKRWVLGEYTYVIIGESEEPDNITFLSQMSSITGKFTNLKFTPTNGMGIIIDSSGNTGGHYNRTEIFSSPTVKGNSFIDEYVIGISGQSGSDYITFNTNSVTFNGSFLGDAFYAVVWRS